MRALAKDYFKNGEITSLYDWETNVTLSSLSKAFSLALILGTSAACDARATSKGDEEDYILRCLAASTYTVEFVMYKEPTNRTLLREAQEIFTIYYKRFKASETPENVETADRYLAEIRADATEHIPLLIDCAENASKYKQG